MGVYNISTKHNYIKLMMFYFASYMLLWYTPLHMPFYYGTLQVRTILHAKLCQGVRNNVLYKLPASSYTTRCVADDQQIFALGLQSIVRLVGLLQAPLFLVVVLTLHV